MTSSSLHVVDEVGDIESHLGGGGWSTIIVVKKTVVELLGHTNDHVVEVGVEVLSLGDISSEWSLVVISGGDIIDVVDTTWSHSDLGEISWPDSSVSVLGLILRVVRSIDVIGDDSISFIPLLVVVLLEVLVGWVDSEALGNDGGQFELFVGLVQQDVVLLIEHTVTVSTVSGKDHESSSDRTTIEGSQEVELRPAHVSSVSSDFTDLFFVTLDTPEGSDIVSVNETLRLLLSLREGKSNDSS